MYLPFHTLLKWSKSMNASRKRNKKSNVKSRIIERQTGEIESLKKKVLELEIDCKDKDEIINSIDSLRVEMNDVVESMKSRVELYDRLIGELTEMKKIMNKEVFKGRWNLVRLLLK